ncbi:DNA polymerase Y family protein [Microbulbifer sp. VAAF005]|uniref:Y-family DNA polymerase n=1 Tax=Microbulbifer sp. VAAF005 TaxID=3034230 RepID=UPI0024ADDC83|nr:DNA polymerase Y family protein [Microbulbifer sp. VAAF005]WHI48260.1 DNA polymerase Y family protein [Microbulbifer sp. VAAF005]
MLWLCIQFPRLPLEVLTRAQQQGEEALPQVVVEKQLVIDRNPAASQCGVETGLSIATASALCADLQLLQRDSQREQQELQQLAQWAYSFTPLVSPQSAGPLSNGESTPAHLYLELSGCLKASGGFKALIQQLSDELEQMGIHSLMGLGHSPSAAHMLSQLTEHRNWLAKSDSPPSPQQWRQWISFAPSKLLNCDKKTISKLYACGIKRVSQLLAIPLSEVGSRFGRPFVDYLARLNGTRQDPVCSYQPPVQFRSELFFPSPLDNSEQLLFPIGRLLRELCSQLQRRQLYTQQLNWHMDFGQNESQEITVELSTPQLDPQRLIALTKLQMERVTLNQPVQSISLNCKHLLPLEQGSLDEDLFGEGSRHKRSQQLLDKLKARLGHQALSGIALKESYLPEQAWQNTDTLIIKSNAKGQQIKPIQAPRPNWLLAHPTKLESSEHKLFYQGELQLLQGPERIDGYWWQHGRHGRDYYIAKNRRDELYWVFQDLTTEEWFLHGVYS